MSESRTFRTATEADLDRMASIACKAYPAFGRTEETVRERMTDPVWGGLDTTWLGEEDGRPHAAQASLYEFRIQLWGRVWPVGGLGAVAVAPDARRRGWARDLVVHTEAVSRERGWSWILLYPFRVDFYASLGWGIAEFRHSYRVVTRDIPGDADAGMVRLGTVAELDRLAPVYRAYASCRNGFLDRDTETWMKLLLRRPPQVAMFERDGEIEGYMFYRYHVDETHPLVQDLVVDELVWATDRAWRGLWGYVRNQADQTSHVRYHAKGDDAFVNFVANPSPSGGEILGGGFHRAAQEQVGLMAKILDVERVAEGRPYGPGSDELDVVIRDPLAPAERTVSLRVEEGRGRVLPSTTGGATGTRPVLDIDIAAWSSLTCGAWTLTDAARAGRAGGDCDVEKWSAMLAAPRWGFLDGF